MKLFVPDEMFERITAITPEYLKENGIEALLLDVDNTLSEHHAGVPADGVEEWIERMTVAGTALMIVSNSKEERIKPFADRIGLPYEALSLKPLGKGIGRALRRLGVDRKRTALAGDQIFTDVLGARLCGIRVLFLRYIRLEDGKSFKLRRALEKKILKGRAFKGEEDR